MKYFIITLLVVITIGSCATAGRMNDLRVGMTREEAIKIMGRPHTVSAMEGVEYLNYNLTATNHDEFHSIKTPYFVRIIDGKVNAFGRRGDFDSTKDSVLVIKNQ